MTTNVCRWVLALVLVVSGFVKAVDPVGSMYKLQEYVTAFSLGSYSDELLVFVALLQAALEFLLGICLLMGIYRRFTAWVTPPVMLFFTVLTMMIYWGDDVADCGCFGEAFTLSNGQTLVKNVLLLLLAVVVFLGRRRLVYCISSKSRWMVTIFAIFYIAFTGIVSLSHLPVIDFGLYTAGADLRALTEGIPGEYSVFDVYERGGETREWPEGERPDSSWAYVESRMELVKEPEPAVINDFTLLDWEMDTDAAPELLADSGYVCVVVIEDVEKASVSSVDKINELYDYCLEDSVPFVAASASEDDAIGLWRKRTGAEYPVLWIDGLAARKIVRANPGLLLIKDGAVAGKWNVADLPAVEEYSVSATGMPDGVYTAVEYMRGWHFWLLLLVLPLLFIVVVDIVANRKRDGKRGGSQQGDDDGDKAVEAVRGNVAQQEPVAGTDDI